MDALEKEFQLIKVSNRIYQAHIELWASRKDTLGFMSQHKDKVALAMIEGDQVTVYLYRQNGPSGDFACKLPRLAQELKAYGFQPVVNPYAGTILDAWGQTPEWEHGLKQLRFIAIWNILMGKGESDYTRQMDRSPDIDKAIRLGESRCRELGAEIY